jgi:hypothetical protein
MFWLIISLVSVGLSVLSSLLQKRPGAPKASGLGDFQVPTADETRVIPVVWGTVKLAGPNVIWYGDLKTVKLKSGGGIFTFGKTTVIGFKYYLGLWLGLCHGPVDDVIALRMGSHPDDKNVPFSTKTLDAANGKYNIFVNQLNLFGGEKLGEGGVLGNINFYLGGLAQAANDYISSKLGLTGGAVAFNPIYSGTGNGTLINLTNTAASILEIITVTFSSNTAFAVSGSVSGALGAGSVNVSFVSTKCSFLITQGAIQWAAGDTITFNTAPPVTNGAPPYPGFVHAVCRQMYVGTSNYIKNMSFVVRRCTSADPLSLGANANISGDANPANIIYECMTNTVWGQGRPTTLFDTASFIAAGNTLATEGLGLSITLDNPMPTDNFITEILNHIDGALYTDPQTGLWTLKLARADYDPATLLTFDQTNVLEKPDFSRTSWEETINQVYVTYIDRASFTERTVKADETANFATVGEIHAQQLKFPGISNATKAQFIAMRELKQHSYPLAQLKIVVNRLAWNLRTGSTFKFTWPALGVSQMIFRATNINYGALEAGRIEITAIEDIYNVAYAAFTPPGASSWTNPVTAATAPVAQLAFETPYHLSGAQRFISIAAVRSESIDTGAEIWVNEGAGFFQITDHDLDGFTPSGLLVQPYSRKTAATDATGLVVTSPIDLDLLTNTDSIGLSRGALLIIIDSEIMSVTGVTDNGDGTWSVASVLRGVMDTVPADHAAGARVWFISLNAAFLYNTALTADVTARPIKMLPYNVLGTIAIASVTQITITTSSRNAKPLPPGNVKVNGLFWPTTAVVDAALTLAHRNRFDQATKDLLTAQDAVSDTSGVEGSYTIDVLVNNVLKQTQTAQTGIGPYTYTALQRYTDDKDGNHTVVFRMTTTNGASLTSVRSTDAFRMSGFGMGFGLDFGGLNG